MNITQLVFSWPREAAYSCEPDTYAGWAIEDYSLEIGGTNPLQIGDVRSWENRLWRVSQVESYTSHSSDNHFNIAVLTLDGSQVQRDPWEGAGESLMYACIAPDGFTFGWPEHPEAIPDFGEDAPALDGWQISAIQEFQGTSMAHSYGRVFICWCMAVAIAQRETIAA
jgi:hypothetical protein